MIVYLYFPLANVPGKSLDFECLFSKQSFSTWNHTIFFSHSINIKSYIYSVSWAKYKKAQPHLINVFEIFLCTIICQFIELLVLTLL